MQEKRKLLKYRCKGVLEKGTEVHFEFGMATGEKNRYHGRGPVLEPEAVFALCASSCPLVSLASQSRHLASRSQTFEEYACT
jgi:hypothetical protein